jgi:hypothetical protein
MSLQQLVGPLHYPGMSNALVSGTPFLSTVLDANGEKLAAIIKAPKTGDIDRVCFRLGTVTTGDTLDVRIETVDGSGLPTGTLWATNTNVSVVVASSDDGVTKEVDLTAVASMTAGDVFALVIVNGSAGNMEVNNQVYGFSSETGRVFPYTAAFLGGAWAKEAIFGRPLCGVRYAGVGYVWAGTWPISGHEFTGFNSGSTPDERGAYFSIPFRCEVSGALVTSDAGGAAVVRLYDSDGTTVLRTGAAHDPDHIGGSTTATPFPYWWAPVVLEPNTFYRITILPSGSNTTYYDFTVASSAILDAFPGGQNFHHTSRSDGGSWTETSTRRTSIELLITALDDGAGAAELAWGVLVDAQEFTR